MPIPAFDPDTRRLNVVIETPKGSRNKYLYDERLQVFRLHKMLPAGAVFPFDFGFVPSTRADDGDPLDAAVLVEEPMPMGCLVTVRLLGVLRGEQTEKGVTIRNDRLVCVPETAKIRASARALGDLPPTLLDQIEHFMTSYNRYEGRTFVVTGRLGAGAAKRLIDEGVQRFEAASKRPRAGGSRARRPVR